MRDRRRVLLGRLDEVGAAVGDALEHGPHDLGPPGAAGHADQRAPGAEVPRRRAEAEQGGHEPHVAGGLARSGHGFATRRSVARMPRSSRSHSTAVPADSITASMPHVISPPRRQATIGKQPPPPRVSNVGRVGADAQVEHAAGAERDLGQARGGRSPGRRATPAGRRRSRRSAATRRARTRCADDAGRVDDRRQHRRRDVQRLEDRWRASRCRRRCGSPVTPALVASVTWTSPPLSVHATHVSTVPKHRSRSRSGSAMSSRKPSLVADALGARRMPCGLERQAHADGAQVLPADAGADRLAGGPVPHDRRRPLVGDADGRRRPPPSSMARAGDLEGGVGHDRGVELHEARHRRVGQHLAVVDVRRPCRPACTIGGPHAAGADVDDEDAHAGLRLRRRGRRTRRAWRAEVADLPQAARPSRAPARPSDQPGDGVARSARRRARCPKAADARRRPACFSGASRCARRPRSPPPTTKLDEEGDDDQVPQRPTTTAIRAACRIDGHGRDEQASGSPSTPRTIVLRSITPRPSVRPRRRRTERRRPARACRG